MDGNLPPPPAQAQPGWLPRRRITVGEYHAMGEAGILRAEDRVELIEGELIEMSPMGAPHAARVMVLTQFLVSHASSWAVVSTQLPVRLGDRSEPQPDLALLQLPLPRYRAALPTAADVLLLIEVADQSRRYDLGAKAALYARHGIQDYWVVDATQDRLTVHRDPSPSGYGRITRSAAGGTLAPLARPDLAWPLADLLA